MTALPALLPFVYVTRDTTESSLIGPSFPDAERRGEINQILVAMVPASSCFVFIGLPWNKTWWLKQCLSVVTEAT